MQVAALSFALLCLALSVQATPSNRDGKFFVVVNPDVCVANSKSGVCLPHFYCSKYSGTVDGKCKLGFGECCIYKQTCGGSAFAVTSYFTSEASTATDKGDCTAEILKAKNVCQLRLDLTTAEFAPPNEEGECVDQYLEVEGITGTSPKICGTNSGQHLYLDVSDAAGPFKVKVTNNIDTPDSEWDIAVEQIACNSPELAPTGCLQYYKGTKGEVKSFNYENDPTAATHANGNTGTRHLQENYNICIRQEPGYCGVKWTPSTDSHAFTLTGDLVGIPGILPPIFGAAINENCLFTDYLVIAGGTATVAGVEIPASIICGSQFPDEVVSDSFQVGVVANDQEGADADFDNRGFNLMYEQVKC